VRALRAKHAPTSAEATDRMNGLTPGMLLPTDRGGKGWLRSPVSPTMLSSDAPMPSPILLFDGSCGFCSRTVQLVLRADRQRALRFASLQGEYARDLLARHPILAGVDSLAWVEPKPEGGEQVFVRSEAVLRLGRYLRFPRPAVFMGRLIPRPLRDRLYDWVAKRRHRWFVNSPSCSITSSAELRDRMVGV
jgi:predicted DCC family thiol-disulfide oxidoreductase YuxK